MRFFMIIFSIYFLALSIMPCGDIHHPGSNENTQSEISSPGHSDAGHADLCSPFCTCSCCGTSMAFKLFEYFNASLFNTLYISKQIVSRDIFFISSFFDKIWQPPKID